MAKKDEYECSSCGKITIQQSNFYNSYSRLYKSKGKMPICKDCVLEIYNEYLKKYRDDKMAIYYMCRMLDVYFDDVIYDAMVQQVGSNKGSSAGVYFQKANSLKQYEGKTFDNSAELTNESFEDSDLNLMEFNNDNVPIFVSKRNQFELVNFWGNGFLDEEYDFLEIEFNEWTTRHKCDEYSEEVLYKEICLQMLDIRKDRSTKNDVTKKVESLQKLMTSANVKPADSSALKSAENVNALGLWTRDIEKYRPAEYFEEKGKYADYDSFKEYIDRMMLRPLKNLLTGSRDFDSEFNVGVTKDGENDGDL